MNLARFRERLDVGGDPGQQRLECVARLAAEAVDPALR
jgi:hypothetical protein